ncbi:serine/threonine-protein phosphatase 2A regulatory subunit B'' subunit beta isoform X1 [Lingula anatina]|uniref:Serine/threonine-protein phosphatase 2A regulatory subunit B'' subunit beta isoform X1 n=1 Tax=Lingula anatina TaxID=7574 RepID=A0A1S3JY65_LINAN|nr:serine/threonine-protein phosphatase 2A regulatory subunit B'' subunit beta isoform X1 [Lingula anatina]|eukprot:XP_013414991.1 serine/threonine-protein phosphatase 2A regulatory subunit B'' subunit beta isoform X1 [Lingula anatina]
MALKPVLKLKIDELFLRWLSETDTQQLLRENLRQIVKGEPITSWPPGTGNIKSSRPASPRIRPSSPSTPPCSPPPGKSSPSPRSPRKAYNFSSKINARTAQLQNSKEQKEKEREIKEQEKDQKKTQPHSQPAQSQSHQTQSLQHSQQRHPRLPQSSRVPKFYFPMGPPVAREENDAMLQRVAEVFSAAEGAKIYKHQMEMVTKACDVPFYWKSLIFNSAGGDKYGFITLQSFTVLWKKLTANCHDDAARFVSLLAKPGCFYLTTEEFVPLIQDVVDTHPGLTFLQDAPEFHSRYVHTVIARIFYCVNRSWSGRITVHELRRSSFLQVLSILEDEEDINQVTEYFSYEHFYVIYCKFWELDKDHDLYINKEDLARHNDHAISTRMIDRIFSGAVTRGKNIMEGKMNYTDFVWFLLAEEDKRQPTSIEYWFRCMDLDGDGVLSMYELEYFYEEQVQKMEAIGIEPLPFEDCLCQMLDLVKPRDTTKITLGDLKACKLTHIFFDTFFNLEKYLDHEQRDPFANARDLDSEGPEVSDWDRYAAEEYEILVAEEGGVENPDDIQYEDDFEPDEDELVALEAEKLQLLDPPIKKGKPAGVSDIEDDLYDFTNEDLGY